MGLSIFSGIAASSGRIEDEFKISERIQKKCKAEVLKNVLYITEVLKSTEILKNTCLTILVYAKCADMPRTVDNIESRCGLAWRPAHDVSALPPLCLSLLFCDPLHAG